MYFVLFQHQKLATSGLLKDHVSTFRFFDDHLKKPLPWLSQFYMYQYWVGLDSFLGLFILIEKKGNVNKSKNMNASWIDKITQLT